MLGPIGHAAQERLNNRIYQPTMPLGNVLSTFGRNNHTFATHTHRSSQAHVPACYAAFRGYFWSSYAVREQAHACIASATSTTSGVQKALDPRIRDWHIPGPAPITAILGSQDTHSA